MTSHPPGPAGQRLLVVSCEYDADTSPQGLRWVKLSRELAALGWAVDVVTLERPETTAGLQSPSLRVFPVFPGPYAALLRLVQARSSHSGIHLAADAAQANSNQLTERRDHEQQRLNWKGMLEAAVRRLLGFGLYPDLRAEAVPFIRACVRELAGTHRYAAAVLSHEPPLALGLSDILHRSRIPVIADLGDPVCAAYTPRRWRRRALEVEGEICSHAAAVVTTSEATLQLLQGRHPHFSAEATVIPQGFDPSPRGESLVKPIPLRPDGPMRIVYTGRFYRFRDPSETIRAVRATSGIELVMAVPDVPAWLDQQLLRAPSIRLTARLRHEEARSLQNTADVLLVIGNDDPTQTPGKLFEYLGVGAPIIYVTRHQDDPGAQLVRVLRRGIVVQGMAETSAALACLREQRKEGGFQSRFDLSGESVKTYSWPASAKRYSDLISRLAAARV